MASERKLERLVNQLTRETVNGEIKWSNASPPSSLVASTQDVIDVYLDAEYKGKTIAIFERRSRQFNVDHEDYIWHSTCHLGFIESSSLIWESYDPMGSLWTLLQVARDSAADVDGIMDYLLE